MAFTSNDTEIEGLGRRTRRSRVDDIEDELDVESFFANYVPLSNLPTPPPVAKLKDHAKTPTPASSQPVEQQAESPNDLLHPSTFLASLIPQNSSIQRPSPHVLQSYLHLANLPEPTVALAACILDSLSGFFIRIWSREINGLSATIALNSPTTPTSPLKSYFAPKSAAQKADLIVLAALKIARDFTHDSGGCSARWWAHDVTNGRFEPRELEASVHCILKDLNYHLLQFSPDLVEEMREELFTPSHYSANLEHEDESHDDDEDRGKTPTADKPTETELNALVASNYCDHYDSTSLNPTATANDKENLHPSQEAQGEALLSPKAIPQPHLPVKLTLTPININAKPKDRITVVIEGLPTPDLSPPSGCACGELENLSLSEKWLELNCC